jgi:hypothetical protein
VTSRSAVTLREITDSNRADVLRLAVTPEQPEFVDGVALSLQEAAAKPDACPWFRAIYADQTPVGFSMITDGVPVGPPEFEWPYYLWRLLIDPVTSAVDTVRRRWASSWSTSGAGRARPSSSRVRFPARGRPCRSTHALGSTPPAACSTANTSSSCRCADPNRCAVLCGGRSGPDCPCAAPASARGWLVPIFAQRFRPQIRRQDGGLGATRGPFGRGWRRWRFGRTGRAPVNSQTCTGWQSRPRDELVEHTPRRYGAACARLTARAGPAGVLAAGGAGTDVSVGRYGLSICSAQAGSMLAGTLRKRS